MRGWLLLGTIALLSAGCSRTLETGYEPVALGLSPTQRRAMYSDPYSPEAQDAQNDRAQEMKARKPTVE